LKAIFEGELIMSELDFTLELNSEHLPKEIEYDLFTEAEGQLKKLAAGHKDLIGAAVNIRRPAHGQTTPLHEVTVVVYSRPDHVAATKKEADPQMALRNALAVVERQIRDRREKLKKHWEQPGSQPPGSGSRATRGDNG
jgi:ribosome-associated translation inhibitor RaiA